MGFFLPDDIGSWSSEGATVIIVYRDAGYAPASNERLFDKHDSSGGWLGRNGSTAGSWGGAIPDDAGHTKSKFLAIPDDGAAHILLIESDGSAFTVESGALTDGNTVALTSDSKAVNLGMSGITSVTLDTAANQYGGQIAAAYWINRKLTPTEKTNLLSVARGFVLSVGGGSSDSGARMQRLLRP
jgi:hypothetical protein